MPNQIIHKTSTTAGAVPTAAQLAAGEFAINAADGKVFLRKADGTVVALNDYTLAEGGDNVFLAATTLLSTAEQHYDATQASSLTLVNNKVSQWADLSGNDAHLTQTTADSRPGLTAINGRTALDFDGVDDFLSIVRASTRPATYIAVVAPKTPTNGCVFSDTTGSSSPRLIVTNSSTTLAFRENDAGDLSMSGIAVDEPAIIAARGSLDVADILLRRTGNVSTATSGGQITSNFGGLIIGARRVSGTLSLPMSMRFGELLIYNRVLSLDEIEVLEGYLAWKWGLQARLPYTHLYAGAFTNFGSQPLPQDDDALIYLSAVSSADSAVVEAGVANAIDTFVKGCKADGIWDAIKASCVLAGARTLNGALVPLKGTAPMNINFVAADYNRATGLKGDGSTKYLNSNRNNNADPQNSKHISVYLSEVASTLSAGRAFIGAAGVGSGRSSVGVTGGAAGAFAVVNSQVSFPAGNITAGFFGGSRSVSSQFIHRQSGVEKTNTSASQTPADKEIYVFARENDAGAAELFVPDRIAFYSIGESLDLALLDNRVTTLINALGAL